MTPDWRDEIDDHYSDDEARRIIERAAQIDKKGTVSVDDLREMAGGASISRAALDRALAEAAVEKRVATIQEREIREEARAAATPWALRRLTPRTVAWLVAASTLLIGVGLALLD